MPSKKRFVMHRGGLSFLKPSLIKPIVESNFGPMKVTGAKAIIEKVQRMFAGSAQEITTSVFRDKQHYRKSRRSFILMARRQPKPKVKTPKQVPASAGVRYVSIPHAAAAPSPTNPAPSFEELVYGPYRELAAAREAAQQLGQAQQPNQTWQQVLNVPMQTTVFAPYRTTVMGAATGTGSTAWYSMVDGSTVSVSETPTAPTNEQNPTTRR